ncbi:hypothetical protein CNMCM5623_000173 [Aspergillus felis]|uniref:Uncharacterized protein n=1 Tax=Aspergillus felis TaxID=1287682 RepID=A0A8H6Q5S6_9EURO|nr:hypothetical protein CNMCM5623_000173 [Aspergillus felis]
MPDLSLAKRALNIADPAGTGAPDLTRWAANNAGKFINIRKLAASGNLRVLVLGVEYGVDSDVEKLAAGKAAGQKALAAPAKVMSTVAPPQPLQVLLLPALLLLAPIVARRLQAATTCQL